MFSPINEFQHDKTNNMNCAPSEDSDQPAYMHNLIRAFAVCLKNIGSLATHKAHSGDRSNWVDAQADLSLRWAHRSFCWFCCAAAQIIIYINSVKKNSTGFSKIKVLIFRASFT